MKFDHEKLDVYQAAINFVITADGIVESLPRGRSYLADQLQRAAASIPLILLRVQVSLALKKKHVSIELLCALQLNLLHFSMFVCT